MSASRYYAVHGRRPRDCWDCDGSPCRCAVKRGARQRVQREIDETLVEVREFPPWPFGCCVECGA